MPKWVTFYSTPGSNIPPVKKMRPNSLAGCRRMSIICTTPPHANKSFMTFNGSVNNPWPAVNATALLECHPDKKWYFRRGPSKFVVKSVRCFWG
ncbi:hypothetical protein Y032_0005g2491 [Ancylostoma ceylanicum]|nr:hypothetical protein Y032_0005g2491 [Ancylostoma ceylanicum]